MFSVSFNAALCLNLGDEPKSSRGKIMGCELNQIAEKHVNFLCNVIQGRVLNIYYIKNIINVNE